MSSTNKSSGFVVALACGVLGLLAFFAFPFVSVSGVGVTALAIATGGSQFVGSLAVLWIEALLAGLVALVAGLQFSGSATVARKKTAGGCLLALGIVGTLLCVAFMLVLNSVSFVGGFLLSLLGLGFWAYFLSMVGTIVSGVMVRKQIAQVNPSMPAPSPFTQYQPGQPPMQQYMSNQQPPMQQYMADQQPSSPQYPSSGQYPPYQPPQQYPPSNSGF